MASTRAARRLTEAHRLSQARLSAETVRLMRSTWPLLDIGDLDGSLPHWLRVTVPVVVRQRQRSAELAGRYVAAFRTLEVGEGVAPTLATQPVVRALTTSLTVTGPVAVKDQMLRSVPPARAGRVAEAGSAAAAMRHVLDGGRDTILGAVREDRQALGWARVTSGDPCAFCAMLASRGAVYGETGDFEAHDGCQCSIEPVYSRDAALPPGSERFGGMWDEARDVASEDGVRVDVAFRRLIEDR